MPLAAGSDSDARHECWFLRIAVPRPRPGTLNALQNRYHSQNMTTARTHEKERMFLVLLGLPPLRAPRRQAFVDVIPVGINFGASENILCPANGNQHSA